VRSAVLFALIVGLTGCRDEPVSDRLPAYPRRTLTELRDVLGLGHGGEQGTTEPEQVEPFVVSGTVGRMGTTYLLEEDVLLCCTGFTVAFECDPGTHGEGERVAVFGRIVRVGTARPDFRVVPGPGAFRVLVTGYAIEPERIVSAESLVQRDNVVDLVDSDSLFARALRESGVGEVLRGAGEITILAPVDAALADLPEDREELRRLVLRHVFAGRMSQRELMLRASVTALTHDEFPVRVANGSLRIAQARTVFEDIRGSNGVLHLIHTVLRPD